MKTFWTNTIWYLILGVIMLFEFIFALCKAKEKKKAVAFFLTLLGLTFWTEVFLLIYFKAYWYYPLILNSGPANFDDCIAGNLFSQFSIASTLLLSIVLDLKFYWYLLFAAAYGGIESLFISLGIYTVSWYHPWITVVMLPFFFLIAKWLFKKLNSGIKPFLYYNYIMHGLFPLNIAFVTWAFMLLKLQDMSYTLFPDAIISRHTLVLIHFIILSVPLMYIHFAKIKLYVKAAIVVAIFAAYYTMQALGLIWIKEGLFPLVAAFSIFFMCLSIRLIDSFYGKPLNQRTL